MLKIFILKNKVIHATLLTIKIGKSQHLSDAVWQETNVTQFPFTKQMECMPLRHYWLIDLLCFSVSFSTSFSTEKKGLKTYI